MTQKQDIGNGMRVFLVTSNPIKYQDICSSTYTALPIDLADRLRFSGKSFVSVRRDNRYIQEISRQEIGLPVIIYEENEPTARDYLDRLNIDGVVIPVGHGDINAIRNLGFESPQDVGIPVFEAHKHFPGYRGYEGSLTREEIGEMRESKREGIVRDDFRKWVVQHFKNQPQQ